MKTRIYAAPAVKGLTDLIRVLWIVTIRWVSNRIIAQDTAAIGSCHAQPIMDCYRSRRLLIRRAALKSLLIILELIPYKASSSIRVTITICSTEHSSQNIHDESREIIAPRCRDHWDPPKRVLDYDMPICGIGNIHICVTAAKW